MLSDTYTRAYDAIDDDSPNSHILFDLIHESSEFGQTELNLSGRLLTNIPKQIGMLTSLQVNRNLTG